MFNGNTESLDILLRFCLDSYDILPQDEDIKRDRHVEVVWIRM